MVFSNNIQRFIDNLCGLPGIGSRTAQRIALYLLTHNRPLGYQLSSSLQSALDNVQKCQKCRNFSENPLCDICEDEKRINHLCIVESALDVWAVEQSGGYQGYYFVLHGHISPVDSIGPDELGLDLLEKVIDHRQWEEVIIATNPTVEGEITAHYIRKKLEPKLQNRNLAISRIAHGVPMGGELEYIDGGTLARAFIGRTAYDSQESKMSQETE